MHHDTKEISIQNCRFWVAAVPKQKTGMYRFSENNYYIVQTINAKSKTTTLQAPGQRDHSDKLKCTETSTITGAI